MADFSVTVTNTVNCFGSPADLWNVFNWGSFKWGDGTSDYITSIGKNLTTQTITADSVMSMLVEFNITVQNSLAAASDRSSANLRDSVGYYYVFPSEVTDAENETIPSYTEVSVSAQTFTSASSPSTTWS